MRCNWFKNAWCHKIVALVIITAYFVLLIFVHDATYVWATLALIVVLFITTFSCASSSSPFILQLRGTRVTGIVNSAFAGETIEENGEGETQIWMTDIPPSYSFVMAADIVPQTPPPSYGSAIFLFPPPYVAVDANKVEQDSTEVVNSQDAQQLRRPMSISTQVSVSNAQETVQRGVSFSTQVSVISTHSQRSPALRARFYISRQVSREDGAEVGNSLRPDQVISEARGRLLLLAKQSPSAEEAGSSEQDPGKVSCRPSLTVSMDDGVEGIDHHKVKHDLRRRVLLSRQASREDQINGSEVQMQDLPDDNISVTSQESREWVTDSTEQPTLDGRTVIILTRQNSKITDDPENTKSEQILSNTSIEIQACGGCVSINIPEDIEESKGDKNT